jgi:hypothetical protein
MQLDPLEPWMSLLLAAAAVLGAIHLLMPVRHAGGDLLAGSVNEIEPALGRDG